MYQHSRIVLLTSGRLHPGLALGEKGYGRQGKEEMTSGASYALLVTFSEH